MHLSSRVLIPECLIPVLKKKTRITHCTSAASQLVLLKQFHFEIDNGQPEKKTCITMEEWIDVWGTIVGKAKRMDDFPMWLQYYPKVLFDIINRSGTTTSAPLHFHSS